LLEEIEKLPSGTVSFGAEASLIKSGIALQSKAGQQNRSWGVLLHTDGARSGKAIYPDASSVRMTYAVGELYLLDILGTLRAGSSGWVEWNAFLNYQGGPNHINRSDIGAQVIVDPATDSVFVQSPYYYMGHLSRFVRPGARLVGCAGTGVAQNASEHDAVKDYIKPLTSEDGVEPAVQGLIPLVTGCFVDGEDVAIVVMNVNAASVDFTISDADFGSVATSLDPHSVRTFTYTSRQTPLLV